MALGRGSRVALADTSLLLRVEIPAAGFDFLLKFPVKPGALLSRVQSNIAETLDDLALRLEGDLIESGHCNKDLYQVAKMECERNLQDWQAKLSQAAAATQRADRARSELTRMREAYLREVAGLRQQLVRKEQAEERGAEFVPDIISHFSVNESLSQEVEDRLEEQRKRMEEQHQSELERLMKENLELLHKFKNKAMQASLQGNLLAQRKEAPEQFHAATQTPTEKHENKATETVSVQHASIEVQTSDDAHGASIAANMPSEDADIEVDELDCLDLDVLVTTVEIPEDRHANSRRRNSKARARSGSVATNDSEVMGKRTSQGRSRTASREFSGGKPRQRKRSPDRDTSVSDLESNASSVGPDMSQQASKRTVNVVNTSECAIQTALDAVVLQAVEDGRSGKPESPVSPRLSRRPKVSSMSTQVDPIMLGLVDVQEPSQPPREVGEGRPVRRPWTQGFDTPASAFPAFAEEAAMDSEGDPETEDQGLPWKHAKSSPASRPTLPELKSPSKRTAVTVPSQDDIKGPLLFSVSSQGHSAAMVSRTDGARPSQRTISRPKLSQTPTPSPRARISTAEQLQL